MPTIVYGIDPGYTGAIAKWNPWSKDLTITDIPTVNTVTSTKKNRKELDHKSLFRVLDPNLSAEFFIEKQQPRPKEGTVSSFRSGVMYGALLQHIINTQYPVTTVLPAVWKRQLGLLKMDKEQVRLVASDLMPEWQHLWPLKKHHNRAEAALLCLYGCRTLGQKAP